MAKKAACAYYVPDPVRTNCLGRFGSFCLLSKKVAYACDVPSPRTRKRLPRQFLLAVEKGGLRLWAVRVQLRPPAEPRDGLGSVLRRYFSNPGADHWGKGGELYDLPHLPLGRFQRDGLHIFLDVSVLWKETLCAVVARDSCSRMLVTEVNVGALTEAAATLGACGCPAVLLPLVM